MQKGVVVDLLDEEIRHVGARDEPACPIARLRREPSGKHVFRYRLLPPAEAGPKPIL